MTGTTRWFAAAALGLWLLFVVQAVLSPILLDDWFPLRYWRDHELGLGALWDLARFNYFHYNPRIGEVWLALVHGAAWIHWLATPLVQLALLPIVFAIAFGRWPRRTIRDLQILVFIQVMIWLVIPLPGVMYFYRPYATNYLWAFTCTLALFVPYRLAAGGPARSWAIPLMFVLGWTAGMCNEHTGPTAMVAMTAFVIAAWRRRRLRGWMIAGALGLFVGYPMLFFAPGQHVRYAGLATVATPTHVLAERGVTGCLAIVGQFLYEARLGLMFVLAIALPFVAARRARWTRAELGSAGLCAAAALAIVVTLFASPKASDRVFFASAVLVVTASAVVAARVFEDAIVRRFAVGACLAILGFHVVRFVSTAIEVHADDVDRLARLAAAPPGSVAVVPAFRQRDRSRWSLGDDFVYQNTWLNDYVSSELYDLFGIDVDRYNPGHDAPGSVRLLAPALRGHVPTYRELQRIPLRGVAIRQLGFPEKLPLYVMDEHTFVDGRPYDADGEHFVRIRGASLPSGITASYVAGCGDLYPATPRSIGSDVLLPVDERFCRGILTAIVCGRDRCWVAGWY